MRGALTGAAVLLAFAMSGCDTLFEQADLLRWHTVEPVAHRGFLFFGGWPHYTALIREKQTGREWVVDSWFRDNGEYPDILDLETWKDGWKPEGFTF